MTRIAYYGMTDQGRKRKLNQDQFLVARLQKSMLVDHASLSEAERKRFSSDADGRLLLVADGMGGHAGGELASELVVDGAAEYVLNTIPWFYRLNQNCDEDFEEELKRALEFCQRRLSEAARIDPTHRNMGTTLTMAYLIGLRLYVVHVGDSRCYLFRDGNLHQVTRDHTMAQALLDEGQLAPELMEKSPLSHVLWNAVGGSDHSSLKPDVYKSMLRDGDRILLCTDGLTRHVADEALTAILASDQPIEQKCSELVDAANNDGGSDNITVVLAEINQGEVPRNKIEGSQETPQTSLADTTPYIPTP